MYNQNFKYLHNCCTRNGDYLILLIKIGNAVKNDDGSQMVVALTITEISYLMVSLLCDLLQLLFVFIFVVLCSLAALFALFPA